MKRIIRGLAGLKFVYVPQQRDARPLPHVLFLSGADVVEVAPAYDHADITSIAAADIVHDFLSLLVSAEPPKPRGERKPRRAQDEL